MPDLDPWAFARRYLTDLEQRLLDSLLEVSAIAASEVQAAATDEVRQLTATVAQRAERLRGILSRLPHNVAEGLLDQFRQPFATRPLTGGERSNALKAFGTPALPLTRKAMISNGFGLNPIALSAFLNGNPAITLGNTIYCKPTYWKADFAASRTGLPLFLHEFTHVIQWDRIGFGRFTSRYVREKKACGSADAMYDYAHRATDFGRETLEGQAQMVEDYTKVLLHAPGADRIAPELKRRLTGSRVYGL